MYNFAGECFLSVAGGIKDVDADKVVGLFPYASDDLDFECHLLFGIISLGG